MIVLSLENILELHALAIMQFGGSDGLRDMGRLESAIASQTQIVFGEELYVNLHQKAAALIRGLNLDHAFVDGNKRTGMLVGLTFLTLNGIAFNAKPGELEDFAVKVATEKLEIATIASWLEKHGK